MPAAAAIQEEEEHGEIVVSSISAWEIALLVGAGRLGLGIDVAVWLERVEDARSVRFVPVNNAIAVSSVQLPGTFHRDPADRLIVATARELQAPVITSDEKIRAYPHVRTIW